jgi:predicted negative regulator of RcsB-dependent stress response
VELLSEEEQWERMKAWLRTNGVSVLALTAVMLLAWFGYQWWKDRGVQQALNAGALYQGMLASFDAGKRDEGYAQIETLRKEYPKSAYVNAADLVAANVHVGNNELDRAAERLQRVASEAVDEKVRPIARLRLARVQSAQGKYDAALATLGTADMGTHEAARLEVRGDVLFAKGDREGALKEYLASRKLLPEVELGEGGLGELLDLKIADLGGTVPASESASPAPAEAP